MKTTNFSDLWNRGMITQYTNELQQQYVYQLRRGSLQILMSSERRHIYLPFKQDNRYTVVIYN